MIAHVGIQVTDIERSKRFYAEVLKPIGYVLIGEYGITPTRLTASVGFGEPPRADFWIYQGKPGDVTTHRRLSGEQERDCRCLLSGAIAAGGKDNGKPGLRLQYNPNYYGGFVLPRRL
jgi:catechol 2,3-dioxygenase-like lactoylglutathione lyase family enzyme